MSLEGFDPKFEDFPDYILGITKEIWEDRGISTLESYYAPDIAVRSASGIVFGNDGVIAATMATLAEFPDRQLLGEDVIWSGDNDSGYLSSHRIISTATHLGDGAYGPASGKTFRYRIIADFGDGQGLGAVGSAEVEAGQEIRLSCRPKARTCTVQ